ncbi:hypothetical protein M3P05_19680 [Sansalvadorimonas sp. 2012CJ34-2]|uniref:Immunity MXAN-0049 protein domain-containing protein n=1 Tax=Parendozoicomonas callyspongiae TaxID=2942213 RepID=A0ABT0PL99_9GAMM|nr:DUF1629 domain-containing protein [Sansalvadorimonas sp. 2012CJ34-2]MCL6272145.1 hypothetical protein [Sansalvadorimonas sp. 2012CJ34-2]
MIYSIHPDYMNYQLFNISGKNARKALGQGTLFHMSSEPTPYKDQWSTLEIDLYSHSGKAIPTPDITQKQGRLFLSEKACKALSPLIASSGELLPVSYIDEKGNKGTGWLFNCLTVSDHALNSGRCLKNEWGDITWLEFTEEKLEGQPLFRTEFDDYLSLFCSESFVEACKQAGLSGVIFSENLAPEPA